MRKGRKGLKMGRLGIQRVEEVDKIKRTTNRQKRLFEDDEIFNIMKQAGKSVRALIFLAFASFNKTMRGRKI